jgi:ribosomal protein S18 acetylase RimI-like enzyme
MTALVRAGRPGDAASVAGLHADRISGGFLSSLGPRFLTLLYRRIAVSPSSILLVAERGGAVVGFVAATTSTRDLYKDFLRHDAFAAAVAALPAALRAPKPLWETLRYGASEHDLPPAEVLSIAVAEEETGHGVGGSLLAAALHDLSERGVPRARVVSAAVNTAAIAMYERAGFKRHSRTEVHAGVAQEVLVWP